MSADGSRGRPPAVQLRAATVRIDGRDVLGPLDLTIEGGERWVLLGPNGSGKTTLLALAGARRQPSSGGVAVLGRALGSTDVRDLHRRISHTSHVLAELMPSHLDALAIVMTGKRSSLVPWFQTFDESDERRAGSALAIVGCEALAARRFESCSQGERQRILLARALFSEPELLILDEPASGLDLPAREALISAVERVVARIEAPTLFLATHHLEEVPPSTTHAALLRAGRLVAAGPIEEILRPDPLRACFGIELQVGRREDRWWAAVTGRSATD